MLSSARSTAPYPRRAVLGSLASLPLLSAAAAAARRRRWEGIEQWGTDADPWRPDAQASPFRLSDAEVVDAFIQAALGQDATTRTEGEAARFVPWRGPIRAVLFGQVGVEQQAWAERTLAWCRMATSLAVTPPGTGAASLAILFSDQPLADLTGPLWERAGAALFPSPEALRQVVAESGPCFALGRPGDGIGLIVAPPGLMDGGLVCLPRMLMAVLGLKELRATSLPSVLVAGGVAAEPTPLDRLLAALATDPALPPELDEATLREILPTLLPRHRPWAGFDPLAAEPPPSAPLPAAGSVFDPDAPRTLRAFAAMAVPPGATPAQVVRWPEHAEVPVRTLGRAPGAAFAALRWCMDWAVAATQLRLRFAETRREEGITVIFGETLDSIWDEQGANVAAYFGNDRSRFDAVIGSPAATADGAVTLLHFTEPGGVLVRTLSLVATGREAALLPPRIGREFLRALGLRGDGAGVGHSLLDRAMQALQPSALDDRLLRVMYGEEIMPGMTREAAQATAARLLGLTPAEAPAAPAEVP